jgi:hypothetical protein
LRAFQFSRSKRPFSGAIASEWQHWAVLTRNFRFKTERDKLPRAGRARLGIPLYRSIRRTQTAVCRSGQSLTPRRPGYWHGGRAGGPAGNVPTRAGFLGIRGRCSRGPRATLAGSEFLEAAYGRPGMETLIREVARICLPRLSRACPNLDRWDSPDALSHDPARRADPGQHLVAARRGQAART